MKEIKNIYYIINHNDDCLDEILDVCIQKKDTLKISNDGKKAIVKLPDGVDNNYKCLSKYEPLSHSEILSILGSDSNWQVVDLKTD